MSKLLYVGLLGTVLCALSPIASATVTYVYTDPQGTPLAEADASGTITATFDYKPYGSQALGSPKAGPGYTGHVNDPDTGFVYMQARYYDPVVGRFLSVDPDKAKAGDAFNFARYGYTNDNPVNHIDPDGRCVDGLTCDQMVQSYGAWAYAHPKEANELGEKIGLPGVGVMLSASGFGGAVEAVKTVKFIYRTIRFEKRLTKVRDRLQGWRETPNKKGAGSRFEDPANPKGNRVRVDKGNPDHEFPSQRVDHVVEQRDGVTVDADGSPIAAPKPASTPEAHIPLTTWLGR